MTPAFMFRQGTKLGCSLQSRGQECEMKKLEVVMKSSAFDIFSQSAASLGISGYEVSEVRVSPSFAFRERQRLYRGHQYAVDLLSRVKVQFAVVDGAAKSLARDLITLLTPDSIAVSTLDEVISMPAGADHTVSISHTERGASEMTRVIH
jgi:nitrogen regulatory protein PII